MMNDRERERLLQIEIERADLYVALAQLDAEKARLEGSLAYPSFGRPLPPAPRKAVG